MRYATSAGKHFLKRLLLIDRGAFQDLFCAGAAFLVRLIFRWSCVLRIHNFGAYPRTGGIILASNHISHFDPPMIGANFCRYVDWMGMEELFQTRSGALLMRALRVFPVKRLSRELTPMRVALRRLQAGRIVGVFPEGGIRAGSGSVLEGAAFWPGVVALSVLSKRPIVPCVILGTDRLYRRANWRPFRRTPVWIGFGAALDPDCSREELQGRLSAAFVQLYARLIAFYELKPEDLPRTPQARKGPDLAP